MKKLLILATAILASVSSSYGQGTIVFQNNAANGVTNGVTSALAASGASGARVSFYFNANPAAAPDSPGWTRFYSTNLISPGIFFGGTRAITNTTTVTGIPNGTTAAFQVRGWLSTTLYADYDAAIAGGLNEVGFLKGESLVMSFAPNNPPSTILVGGAFKGLVLNPVPEPSSIALGLLGLGAIALFRRRK